MKFKYLIFTVFGLVASVLAIGQSKTTEALHKKHDDALHLFFYNNTLRMLNQSEDKAFDEVIKDIEKLKFLMIKKEESFVSADYKKLVGEYKAESYEEMMTSRLDGKNFDVFMKDGKGKGMLVLVNDDENLYVLDIIGSVALDQVTKLYSTLDESSDIRKKIENFTGHGGREHDRRKKQEKNN
jgi:hypothetical protein